MPGPGMFHGHPGQLREPRIELALHHPRGPRQITCPGAHSGAQNGAAAGHDPVAALPAVDPPHRGAHRVGRRDPPARRPAQRRQHLRAKLRRHHREQEDLHQPVTGITETLQMPVDRQDHPPRRHRPARRLHPPAAAIPAVSRDRRGLVDIHATARQSRRQPAHIPGRLQHYRARRIQPRAVMPAARQVAHLARIQHFARLAQRLQMPRIAFVMGHGRSTRRAIHLARRVQVIGRNTISPRGVRGKFLGPPVQRNQRPFVPRAGIIRAGQIMRQIDHETRIAPRRALGHAPGLQHRDPRTWLQPGQPPRRAQPGKARAHHHKIRRPVRLQHARRALRLQNGIPRRHPPLNRKAARRSLHQSTASSASSARSIHRVFSRVY